MHSFPNGYHDIGDQTNFNATISNHDKSYKLRPSAGTQHAAKRPTSAAGFRPTRMQCSADVVAHPRMIQTSVPRAVADCWATTTSPDVIQYNGDDVTRLGLRQDATCCTDVSCSVTWFSNDDGNKARDNRSEGRKRRVLITQQIANIPATSTVGGPKALSEQSTRVLSDKVTFVNESKNVIVSRESITPAVTENKLTNAGLQQSRRQVEKPSQQSASAMTEKLTAQLTSALADFKYTTVPYREDDVIDALHRYLRVQQRQSSTKVYADQNRSSMKTLKSTMSTSGARPASAAATLQRMPAAPRAERAVRRPPLGGPTGRRRWQTTSTMNDFHRQRVIEFRRGDLGPLSDLIVIRSATPQPVEQRNRCQTAPVVEVPDRAWQKCSAQTQPGSCLRTQSSDRTPNGTERAPATDSAVPELDKRQPTRPGCHNIARTVGGDDRLAVEGVSVLKPETSSQCDCIEPDENNEHLVNKVPLTLPTMTMSRYPKTGDRRQAASCTAVADTVDRHQSTHTTAPHASVLAVLIDARSRDVTQRDVTRVT